MSDEIMIEEDIVTVHNPCPKTTNDEVWKRAETLPNRHGGEAFAFNIDCTWGGQLVAMAPGDSRKFVERVAKQFFKNHSEEAWSCCGPEMT